VIDWRCVATFRGRGLQHRRGRGSSVLRPVHHWHNLGELLMPRPRAPKEVAKVTGAAKNHPSRFAKRSDPQTGPLGQAPAWMSAELVAVWEEFKVRLPWLQESDRFLVEIATIIRAKVLAGEEVSSSELGQLRLCCGMMGGSPADRSKVTIVEEPDEDPMDVYFN
jgi:hypothetical protein